MCLHPRVIVYRSRLNKISDSDIRVYGAKESVLVTCGKCPECIKRYQNDWTVRNYFQFRETQVAVFFTLTYDPDHVPVAENDCLSVCKTDVQLFMKRFREYRRKHGFSTGFKYFITSEYGPRTLRPHYHGLLHGVTLAEFLPFRKAWNDNYGFVQCREINALNQRNAMQSARYVAKYCSKGLFENPLIAKNLVEPTFHLISNGLGESYVTPAKRRYHLALDFPHKRNPDGSYSTAYLDEVINRLKVTIPPCTYSLPRYYKERIFDKRRDLQAQVADRICQRFLDLYEGELEIIQSERPGRTRFEASIVHSDKVICEIDLREDEARQNFVKTLNKSQL